MRASNLQRHIRTKHPEIDEETITKVMTSDDMFVSADDPDSDEDDIVLPPRANVNLSGTTTPSGGLTSSGRFVKERMYRCPFCEVVMRASNMGRHIKSRHPELADQDIPPLDQLEVKDDGAEESFETSDSQLRRVPQVKCPECELTLRPSNLTRHWGRRHKDLPFPKDRPKRYYEMLPMPDSTSFVSPQITVEPIVYENEEEEDLGEADAPELEDDSFLEPEVMTIEPIFEGSLDYSNDPPSMRDLGAGKHGSGHKRDRQFQCDSCPYESRFRGNLDRHCRRHRHYSEYLISTSKTPKPYADLRPDNVLPLPQFKPSKPDATLSPDAKAIMKESVANSSRLSAKIPSVAKTIVLTPCAPPKNIAAMKKVLVSKAGKTPTTPPASKVDKKAASVPTTSVEKVAEAEDKSEDLQGGFDVEDEIEDEIDAAPKAGVAAGESFCNFDISGILAEDISSEDDELAENMDIDYKVL